VFLAFYHVLADIEVLHIRRAERESVTAEALNEVTVQHSDLNVNNMLRKTDGSE